MFRRAASIAEKAALPPGSLVHIGPQHDEPPVVQAFRYDAEGVEFIDAPAPEGLRQLTGPGKVVWVNVVGVHDVDLVRRIGETFAIHPLILEDVVNTHQRPKIEDYDDCLFVVMKLLYYDDSDSTVLLEQVSMVLGKGWVISFQEGAPDPFAHLAERLAKGRGRIRQNGADYLAYAILDTVVDGYFGVLESLSEDAEDVEDELLDNPQEPTLRKIYRLKRELNEVRRGIWPLREMVAALHRGESGLISRDTLVYLRDVQDHATQVLETTESLRDTLSGMLDLYLNSVSNRMNEVMKMLTIVATIFIPLTFLAGIYGMNFDFMPELHWRFGYPGLLILMGALLVGMVVWFRRKGWF